MRNKWLGAALAAAVLLGTLSGCTLADPEDGAAEDRLIGLYITPEHLDLFDFEGYLEDHLNAAGGEIKVDGDTSAYQGRMYAEISEPDENGWREYTFPVEGAPCFFTSEPGEDERVSGRSVTAPGMDGLSIKYADEGVFIEGTLWLNFRRGNAAFFNPVYQTAAGEVYLTAGTGMSVSNESDSMSAGSFSHTLSATHTTRENGGEPVSETFTIDLTVAFWTPPDRVAVTQMSENGAVLRRDEFAGGVLPDTLDREPGTAYYIVEEYRNGEETKRTLEDGAAEYLWFRAAGEDTFCTSHGVEIKA